MEGAADTARWAGALARPTPTCPPDATLGSIRKLLEADAPGCVVIDPSGVVLGLVRSEATLLPDDTPVLRAAVPAPRTVRPTIPAGERAASMDDAGERHIVVTTLDGRLVGLIGRSDVEREGAT